jgi:hypothetical protein
MFWHQNLRHPPQHLHHHQQSAPIPVLSPSAIIRDYVPQDRPPAQLSGHIAASNISSAGGRRGLTRSGSYDAGVGGGVSASGTVVSTASVVEPPQPGRSSASGLPSLPAPVQIPAEAVGYTNRVHAPGSAPIAIPSAAGAIAAADEAGAGHQPGPGVAPFGRGGGGCGVDWGKAAEDLTAIPAPPALTRQVSRSLGSTPSSIGSGSPPSLCVKARVRPPPPPRR